MSQEEVQVGMEVAYRVGRGWGKAQVVEVRRLPHNEDMKLFVLLTPKGNRIQRTAQGERIT